VVRIMGLRDQELCGVSGLGSLESVLMARFIMGAKPGEIIDHRNHDTLDNRRKNLRICTSSQSAMNRRKRSSNTSGFIGVRWYKRTQKWAAEIDHEGITIFLGYYADKLVAKRARDFEAAIPHREFVQLNEAQ
jgi:HNH endonuclease